MSTETTQPTDQGYDGNYYGNGDEYGTGDPNAQTGGDYYNQYDDQGNWIGDGAGGADPAAGEAGGYDANAYDAYAGYDGGGNPMNELNETGAEQQYQQQYVQDPNNQQQQQYQDQEMKPRGYTQQQQQQQQQQSMQQGQQGQMYPPHQQGGTLSHAQAQQMVLNQNAPAEVQRQLNQLLGKSPGTALKEHEPESDGWFADIMTLFGTSLGFKIYITYLLWSSLVLFTLVGYDFVYATLYRMMVPPESEQSLFGQSAAYLCIFFSMSFFVVSMICVVVDMLRDFWTSNSNEPRMWGMLVYANKGPWPTHTVLLIVNLLVPLFWSFVSTMILEQSFFYFWQHFAYTSQTIMMFTVMIVFIWFWFRAGREKGRALARRKTSPDECVAVRQTCLMEAGGKPDVLGALSQEQDEDPEKVTKWWRSDIVLTEWGMDQSSLLYMILLFAGGFGPLLVILLFLTTEGETGDWDATWLVMAVIFFCVLILLHQTAMSRRKKGVSTACGFLGIAAFIILGLVGGGAAGNGALVGVFVVMLLFTQGMLTRKRLYTMTRREIYNHFKQPFDEEHETKRAKKIFDSYCCCCKNLVFACCRCCFDINKVFGYEYPEIHKIVKAERKKRVCLRTDQNFLAAFWWILSLALCVMLGLARLTLVDFSGSTNAKLSTAAGTDAVLNALPVCSLKQGGPLTLYEMSLLASLSLSAGSNGKTDYTTWFSTTRPQYVPNYNTYPNTQAKQSNIAQWTTVGYVPANASSADVSYVAVRGTSQGANWMQSLDAWGDSITLQIAGALAPHMLIWPTQEKASFVHGVSFLKRIYGGKDMLSDIETYVRSLPGPVILIGHGFAGGAAQMVALRTGQKAVTFNAPGIGYLYEKYDFPNPLKSRTASTSIVSVSAARNLYSLIDLDAHVGNHQQIECAADSHQKCTDMGQVVRTLKTLCGDAYGRTLV